MFHNGVECISCILVFQDDVESGTAESKSISWRSLLSLETQQQSQLTLLNKSSIRSMGLGSRNTDEWMAMLGLAA
jgi:hypothetical protein